MTHRGSKKRGHPKNRKRKKEPRPPKLYSGDLPREAVDPGPMPSETRLDPPSLMPPEPGKPPELPV